MLNLPSLSLSLFQISKVTRRKCVLWFYRGDRQTDRQTESGGCCA